MTAAKAFYDGTLHQDVRAPRASVTEFFNLIFVDGLPAT